MGSVASESNAIYITLDSSDSLFFTIFSGVLVFVICQIFVEGVLKPYRRYKELKAKISYALVMYAYIYGNPLIMENSSKADREKYIAVGDEFRKLASELSGHVEERWSILGKTDFRNTLKAADGLIGLSNTLIVSEKHMDSAIEMNNKRVKIIKEALKICKGIEL